MVVKLRAKLLWEQSMKNLVDPGKRFAQMGVKCVAALLPAATRVNNYEWESYERGWTTLAAMAAARLLLFLLIASTTLDAHPLFWPSTCHGLCRSVLDGVLTNDGSLQLDQLKPSDGVQTINNNGVSEIGKPSEAGTRRKRGGIFFTPPFRSG